MGVNRRVFLGAAAAATACRRAATGGYLGHVFVANHDGPSIAVVDLAAFAAVRHIALEDAPRLVITHPAQPYVYAAAGAKLVPVSAATLEAQTPVKLAAEATELAFSPDGGTLYALLSGARAIGFYDARTLAQKALVSLGSELGRFTFTRDAALVAATLPNKGAVAIVDTKTAKVRETVAVGGTPYTARFRSDSQMLVVGDRASKCAVMVDTSAAARIAVRIPLGLEPLALRELADGGQMFFTGAGMDAVVTLYPYQTEVGSTTLAGRTPGAMGLSDAPPYLFVANPASASVTILNVATQSVVSTVGVGRQPVAIAVTPDQEYALVLNQGSGDMSVLHIPTIAGRRNKASALFTQIPVGSGPVSAAVRLG